MPTWWGWSTVGWIADQQARIEERFGPGWYINERARSRGGLRFTGHRLRWSRRVPVDTNLAKLSTHSLFLVGEPGTDAFLADELAFLMDRFPDGRVEEPYVVELSLAVRGRDTREASAGGRMGEATEPAVAPTVDQDAHHHALVRQKDH